MHPTKYPVDERLQDLYHKRQRSCSTRRTYPRRLHINRGWSGIFSNRARLGGVSFR